MKNVVIAEYIDKNYKYGITFEWLRYEYVIEFRKLAAQYGYTSKWEDTCKHDPVLGKDDACNDGDIDYEITHVDNELLLTMTIYSHMGTWNNTTHKVCTFQLTLPKSERIPNSIRILFYDMLHKTAEYDIAEEDRKIYQRRINNRMKEIIKNI